MTLLYNGRVGRPKVDDVRKTITVRVNEEELEIIYKLMAMYDMKNRNKLIRTILEERYKKLCPPMVSDQDEEEIKDV